jgi:phosphoribulokinase
MRWVASLVAETHRIISRGGIFLYPKDARPGYENGRLRMVYECAPIAMLVAQAGGLATDGSDRLLEQQVKTLHGRTRTSVHNAQEAAQHKTPMGEFTDWRDFPDGSDILFYEGLHGAVRADDLNIAKHADLKIGVVPVINLEWTQKIHRDKAERGYSTEAVTDVILRRMDAYVKCIVPQFSQTDINFQRVPVVDTSNPFIARTIPTPDESLVVIRFANPRGIDFPYLTQMIHGSWMSRANSIVIPGNKMDLAMQLILTPLIMRLKDNARRA